MDNPDTARRLLKALYHDERAGTLTVCLLDQPTRAQDLALAPLLDELNRTHTVFPGAQLGVVYETLSDDESCPASPCLVPIASQPQFPATKTSGTMVTKFQASNPARSPDLPRVPDRLQLLSRQRFGRTNLATTHLGWSAGQMVRAHA